MLVQRISRSCALLTLTPDEIPDAEELARDVLGGDIELQIFASPKSAVAFARSVGLYRFDSSSNALDALDECGGELLYYRPYFYLYICDEKRASCCEYGERVPSSDAKIILKNAEVLKAWTKNTI